MKLVILGAAALAGVALYFLYTQQKPIPKTLPKLQSVEDIRALFPTTVAEIKERAKNGCAAADKALAAIYAVPKEERTFDNTVQTYDAAFGRFHIISHTLETLTLVSPDEAVRTGAQEWLLVMQSYYVDNFGMNPRLYKAFSEYVDLLKDPKIAAREALTDAQKYFLDETMLDFHRSGLQLPEEKQQKIKEIRKELTKYEKEFELNIAADQHSLEVEASELTGLDKSFIDSLKKTASGKYLLGTDMPTYNKIFEQCSNRTTREKYYKMYIQRVPENGPVLVKMIDLRNQLAQALGYSSYASLDLENQMAKTPETVVKFLDEIGQRARIKCAAETALLQANLPQGIPLAKNKEFYPWDLTFTREEYKKKHLAISEEEIAAYFPAEHTIPALLDIYEKFFSINFKRVPAEDFWHKDLIMLAVYKNGAYIGSVILDLFPRPFKYTHAAASVIMPSVRTKDGQWYPALIVVMANFPPALADRPQLLQRRNVITFFHEFGHSIHALLGATELYSTAGTSVKTDFVEMPSQMLEEWLWDPAILKQISSHYKTKEPLSDEMIQKIRKLKHLDSGTVTMRQLSLASAGLEFSLPDAEKHIKDIWKKNHEKYRSYLQYEDYNKSYLSFGHLADYADRYYSYLWCLVYACDLFSYIKQHGLLNPAVGEKYISEVIGKGGSEDPMKLITHFLGRKPTSDAYFKDLGL